MVGAMGRIVRRSPFAAPPERFAWTHPAAVARLAAEAGMALQDTGDSDVRLAVKLAPLTAGFERMWVAGFVRGIAMNPRRCRSGSRYIEVHGRSGVRGCS